MVKPRRSRQPRPGFNHKMDLRDLRVARDIKLGIIKVKPLSNENIPHERSYSALLEGKAKYINSLSITEIEDRQQAAIKHIRKNQRKLKKLTALPRSPENDVKIAKLHSMVNEKTVKLQMLNTYRHEQAETMETKRRNKEDIEAGLLVRLERNKIVPAKREKTKEEVFKNFK